MLDSWNLPDQVATHSTRPSPTIQVPGGMIPLLPNEWSSTLSAMWRGTKQITMLSNRKRAMFWQLSSWHSSEECILPWYEEPEPSHLSFKAGEYTSWQKSI